MSVSISKITCLICLFCIGLAASSFAQSDTVVVRPKREKQPIWPLLVPSGIRAGAEIGRFAKTAFSDEYEAIELKGDLQLGNIFFLTLDLGSVTQDRSNPENTFQYRSSGTFQRIGFDYNALWKKTDTDAVTFGLRFARATFDQTLTYQQDDGFWGGGTRNLTVEGLQASWVELVSGIRVSIFKNLYISPELHMMFLVADPQSPASMTVGEIPAYGKAESNTRVAINYAMYYRLGVPNKKRQKKE